MSAWLTILWCIAIPLGLLWLLCAAGNLCCIIGTARRGRSVSVIPFVGGVSGALAVLVCPVVGIWHWFWLPLLIDFSGFLILTSMLRRMKHQSRGDAQTQ